MKKTAFIIANILFLSLFAENSQVQVNVFRDPSTEQFQKFPASHEAGDSNQKLLTAIEDALQASHRKFMINIRISEGIVTLKGFVNSQQDKQDVENIVANVPGVKKVDSQLEVRK